MKKIRFLGIIWSMISFVLVGSVALAASTVGTNLSTTGTFTTTNTSATAVQFQNAGGTNIFVIDTSNTRAGVNAGGTINTTFEVGGTASISGLALFGANASVAGNFELTAAAPLFGVNAGGFIDTTFELGGTASISGIITLGGTGSTGGQIRPAANSATAFRFQNAAGTTNVLAIDTTNTRVGVNAGGAVDTTFEVGGTASVSGLVAATDVVAGSTTASASTTYVAEFVSTATTSVLFGGTSVTKGTCLKLKATNGSDVFARVVGTTLTINTTSCR